MNNNEYSAVIEIISLFSSILSLFTSNVRLFISYSIAGIE